MFDHSKGRVKIGRDKRIIALFCRDYLYDPQLILSRIFKNKWDFTSAVLQPSQNYDTSWTQEDIKILINNYETLSIKKLQKLLIKRQIRDAKTRMASLRSYGASPKSIDQLYIPKKETDIQTRVSLFKRLICKKCGVEIDSGVQLTARLCDQCIGNNYVMKERKKEAKDRRDSSICPKCNKPKETKKKYCKDCYHPYINSRKFEHNGVPYKNIRHFCREMGYSEDQYDILTKMVKAREGFDIALARCVDWKAYDNNIKLEKCKRIAIERKGGVFGGKIHNFRYTHEV